MEFCVRHAQCLECKQRMFNLVATRVGSERTEGRSGEI